MAELHWWLIPVTIALGVILLWLALVLTMVLTKPDDTRLRDAVRLLPDTVRLLRRLTSDASLPRRVRVALALLLIYLALPIDLIPDFLPGIGFADDAIITALVLRYVVRQAGPEALGRHWPGTPEGLAALRRVCRLPASG